ncbi:BglG family transcription antiterminator [Paenibacillus alkaliterrae]|uniref:BglG family transcription antiterminator n=1 Tax=Paenibacillus alkaliterrae TaxID=320909 RepID=UPI001F2B65AF|nr:BglG family transcription antiterminator [Paenibacillus alkaliterrae]MCF2938436.1 BglG family transcription antiterminator [Paenibacillus alkaliterrae]
MAGPSSAFNSRQKQILALLLQSAYPVTLKVMSEEIGLSIRTIQRELEGISEQLVPFDLIFVKKTGVGLSIEGSETAKKQLQHLLSVSTSSKNFSQEERRHLLIPMLLYKREWTKLYYFSSKLKVTEATISNDLDKLEPWFEKHRIQLVRKPGIGVCIEADEKSIRGAIIDHLYQHVSQEQLMDILSSYSFRGQSKLELSIRNQLLHFIDPAIVNDIEHIVQRSEAQRGYEMTDSAYVGFVVHIALAVQRIKSGERIAMDAEALHKLQSTREFKWARQMAEELSIQLDITIPEDEMGYITMHLLGAKGKRLLLSEDKQRESSGEFYVHRLVRIMENELKITFDNDHSLNEALLVHLEAAINRIRLHMEIRNPLLDHIRETYPDIYRAARKASLFLQEELQAEVPEEETGYLAMHFGAAIMRAKTNTPQRFQVLLACSSGMGTSKLLAAQIERNFPHIHIIDTVSLLQLESALQRGGPIDLIISTVQFEHEKHRVVVVNSFLKQVDIDLINMHLYSLPLSSGLVQTEYIEIEDTVMTVNRYGEGVVQLTNHMFFADRLEASSKLAVIKKSAALAALKVPAIHEDQLVHDLLQREELGGIVLEASGLSMLHCRSEAVPVLMVGVLRFMKAVPWSSAGNDSLVQTVLLLLAPRTAPKEHIETIGEISAMLIEDDFVDKLIRQEFPSLQKELKSVISRGYINKTGSFFWGKR